MLQGIIAKQLRHPAGLIGRYVLPWLWNRRNAALNDSALNRLGLKADDRALDVGFGGGYLIGRMLRLVHSGHVVGVDASALMVEQCGRKFSGQIKSGSLKLYCEMADSLPFEDGQFNKISSVNSLFYWPDVPRGIRELRRVSATGGLLVLAFTCKRDLDKRGFGPSGIRSVTADEVTAILRAEGYGEVVAEQEADRYREFVIVTART